MSVNDPRDAVHAAAETSRRARGRIGAFLSDPRALTLWPIGVVAAMGLFLSAVAAVHTLDEWAHGEPISSPRLIERSVVLVVGIALVVLTYGFYRRRLQRHGLKGRVDRAPLYAVVAAIGLHGAGTSLFEMLDSRPTDLPEFARFAAYLVVFACGSFFLTADLRGRTPLVRQRLEKRQHLQHRPHLVLFLSRLYGFDDTRGWPTWLEERTDRRLADDLDALKREKERDRRRQWSWEPVLSAIHEHLASGSLRVITVVPSPDSAGQLVWLHEVLARYKEIRSVVDVRAWVTDGSRSYTTVRLDSAPVPARAIPFEDFDALGTGMHALLHHLDTVDGVQDYQVTFDFTGGQKPTSVVAAVASFNTLVQGQYVQTNSPWAVLAYDIVTDPDVPAAG